MDSNQRKKDQNKFKQIMNYFYRLLKVSCLYLFSKAVQLWMMPCHIPDSILNTNSAVFRAYSNIPVSPDQKFDFSHISKPQSHIYEEAHDQEQ